MRHLLLSIGITFLSLQLIAQNQNVGIGTATPDSSAMLDIQSMDKGVLVPRMTTAQREAISNVANGLLVYDTETNSFWFFQDSAWQELVGGSVKGDGLSDEDGDTRIQVEESPNDNTIRFDATGIESMVLTPDGNLQVKGGDPDDAGFMELFNGDTSQFLRLFGGRSGDPAPFLGWRSGSPFRFITSESNYAGFTEHMRIDGGGNVGIGTTAPNERLHVLGSIQSGIDEASLIIHPDVTPAIGVGGSTRASILKTAGTDSTGAYHLGVEIPSNDPDDGFYIATDSNQDGIVDKLAMKIRADGSVGIGTSAPDAKFEVRDFARFHVRVDNPDVVRFGNLFSSNDIASMESFGSAQIVIDENNAGNPAVFDVKKHGAFGTALLRVEEDGDVGIGTTSPDAKLDVENGAILAQGSTGSTPVSGAGTRMMWVPAKAALRAGEAFTNEWDNANIGQASAVLGGNNNKASGSNAFIGGGVNNTASGTHSGVVGGNGNNASGSFWAFVGGGLDNIASGIAAFAGGGEGNDAIGESSFVGGGTFHAATGQRAAVIGGTDNVASGDNSLVVGGNGSTASGDNAFVAGSSSSTASGRGAFASGVGLIAESYSEAVFGTYNVDPVTNSATSADPFDRLFVVGNGSSSGSRSDALVIRKSGNTGIRTCFTNVDFNIRAISTNDFILNCELSNGDNVFGVSDTSAVFYNNPDASGFWTIWQHPDKNLNMVRNGNSVAGFFQWDTGIYFPPSDRRLKDNVQALPPVLSNLMRLKPSRYSYKSDPDKVNYLGFIAQDIAEIFPELVIEPANKNNVTKSPYVMDRAGVAVVAVRAIQEQQEIIEGQQVEINDLRTQLLEMHDVKQRLEKLEKLVTDEMHAKSGEE